MELIRVERENVDTFVMLIKHENGDREKWVYERSELNGQVSFSQISRDR